MNLCNLISSANGHKKVKIGLVVTNKNGEVILIKENLKRINKFIYNIPTIDLDIDNLEENKIIAEFNKKYSLKINKLSGYVNHIKILDDNCEKIEQINLCTEINEKTRNSSQEILNNLDLIEENECIPKNVRNTLEIFNYNKQVTRI